MTSDTQALMSNIVQYMGTTVYICTIYVYIIYIIFLLGECQDCPPQYCPMGGNVVMISIGGYHSDYE